MIAPPVHSAKQTAPVNPALYSSLVAAFYPGLGGVTRSSIPDQSPWNNYCKLTNVSIASGTHGRAMSFNGTTAIATINDNPQFNFTTKMTLALWCNFPSYGGNNLGRLIARDSVANSFIMNLNSTNSMQLQAGGTAFSMTAGLFTFNIDTCIVGTQLGTAGRIFLNGRMNSGTVAAQTTGTGSVCIGNRIALDRGFSGLIYCACIANRPWTGKEVQQFNEDMYAPIRGV